MLRTIAIAAALLPGLAAAYDPVLPSFPLQDGWLGADAAYSIPLDTSNRAVWLFGDTFVRNDGKMSRAGARMIGNSIAIRNSDGHRQTIEYFWQGKNSASPDAFFSSGSGGSRFWPEDGFVWDGKLYVCLTQVRNTGDGPFDFQCIGVTMAAVANPQEPPARWHIHYSQLYARTNVLTGISTVVRGDHAYLYACRDDGANKGNRSISLGRIALKALDSDPAAGLEYLNQQNAWVPGSIHEDAKVIMDRGVTELT